MKRIPKKFTPKDKITYQYKDMFFRSMPKGFVLRYWVYDEESKEYYGILRKRSMLLEGLAGLCILMSLVFYFGLTDKNIVTVQVPKQMMCINGNLEINITNSSNRQIRFIVLYNNEEVYIKESLEPGHAVGTEKIDVSILDENSIQANVIIQSFNNFGRVIEVNKKVLINNVVS